MARKKLTETDRKQMVADQFIKGLERLQEAVDAVSDPDADQGSWNKPWASFGGGLPRSIGTGKVYSGTNTVSCMFAASKDGAFFSDPRWGTTNQWREHCGWQKNPDWKGRSDSFKGIPKWLWAGEGEEPKDFFVEGEARRTTLICVWKPFTVGKDDNDEKSGYRIIKLVKVFGVYNAEQIACAPSLGIPEVDPSERYAECQTKLDELGISFSHGGDRAYYMPSTDTIRTPKPGQFQSVEDYWSTMWHEVTHATGHQDRLNREFGKRFGDDAYAFEELVAELGSVMVCAELGVEGRLQHHAYLASWLKRIEADPRALFTAASKAQAAAKFILTGGAKAQPQSSEPANATNASMAA